MRIRKAVITMAGNSHRDIPLQHVVTGEGRTKHVVALQIEEMLEAGIERVALVTRARADALAHELMAQFGSSIRFIEQSEPLGFGHAVLCTEDWIGGEPLLVQVCDHIFITYAKESCVQQLLQAAGREGCAVSAVQATHESQLPYFGVVGGQRVRGEQALYDVETVIEKPSPTIAEECCLVSGLRQGMYLGFFGIHALTASVFQHLRSQQREHRGHRGLGLTEALGALCGREKYLALEVCGHRIDLEGPFGLLRAQLGLALHGRRREDVLRLVLEEVARARASAEGADVAV